MKRAKDEGMAGAVAFFALSPDEQRAALDRQWRGDPAFIGPVGPPMVIAMRQDGYLDWSVEKCREMSIIADN